MNATLRSVFEEDRYSPLDSAELRLAPSSNSVDPKAKRCFTEAELAQKCPTLLFEKKPAPAKPADDKCPGYFPVDFGDGYVKDFGDTDNNGGFTPTIPSGRIEEYVFPTAPNNKTLTTKGNNDTIIKQGTLIIKMTPRTAQAVQSIKWSGKEYLKTPMFTTAAVDVPKGVSDKVKRVGETGAVAKSTSKVIAVAASSTTAFTQVQAAYSLPPGTILDGKRISHESTLSTTNITKNIAIASNMIARYTSGVSLQNPFVSGRFNIPMFTLTPEFKKIYVYRKSKKAWEIPTQAQLALDNADVLAIIFTNTSQTHAMGVRPVAFPKPKKFGSTFNNKLTTNIVRSATGIIVSTTLTVGTRGGNPGQVYAPAGIYTVVQDNIFGTHKYVYDLLNKIYAKDAGGKCPPCKPITPAKSISVDGKIVKVFDKNLVQIKYTKPDKKVIIMRTIKLAHNMKLGDTINVILGGNAPYAFKAISKKAVPKPTPSATRAVAGNVVKVLSANQVQIKYTKPDKKIIIMRVTKNAHGMKLNEAINVNLKNAAPYAFVSIAKKAAPKPTPSATRVILARVTKVVGPNTVTIRFTDPSKKLRDLTMTKTAHNMKLNEIINLTVKNVPPYTAVSIAKKAAAPATTRAVAGTVVKVINANQVQIKYTKPDKKVVIMRTVKNAHNMKLNEAINVNLKNAAPYAFVSIAKKAAPKPVPKPAANRVVAGRVLKVINANQVQVRYTNPAKKVITSNVTKNAHNMKVNEIINVGLKPSAPYAFVSIAKKTAPKPAPASTANRVIPGKVTQVLTADRVKIQYKDPANKLITYTITKKAHNMKAGEMINITIKKVAPFKFVAISKKAAPKPAPKPSPKPAPKPAANRIVAGTVTKVINANQVQIKFTKPDKKVVIMTATKNGHNMKLNESINIGLKNVAPYAFITIAKKSAPKPVPKPAANRVIEGTVVKVINANQVQIKYTKPDKKVVIMTATKNAHNMKVNEAIKINLKNAAPYAFISIAKK
jgi:hypothetical protein